LTKYGCCDTKFSDGHQLTEHVRTKHQIGPFGVEYTCYGTNFAQSKQLRDYMKTAHEVDLKAEV
jgi:hypothetical protein